MYPWEWPVFWDDFARIGAAALLGGALGLEREWKGHWAGLRTHMMVSIGCAIFVIGGLTLAGEQKRGRDARDSRHRVGHRFSRRRHDSEARSEAGDQRPHDGQLDLAGGRAGHDGRPGRICAGGGRGNRLAVCAGRLGSAGKVSSNAGKPRIAASASSTTARKRSANRTTRSWLVQDLPAHPVRLGEVRNAQPATAARCL